MHQHVRHGRPARKVSRLILEPLEDRFLLAAGLAGALPQLAQGGATAESRNSHDRDATPGDEDDYGPVRHRRPRTETTVPSSADPDQSGAERRPGSSRPPRDRYELYPRQPATSYSRALAREKEE